MTEQLYSKDVLIIGQSLADPDLRTIVDDAVRVKRKKGAPGRITLLSFEADENMVLVFEARGLDVCVGGIDDLVAAIGDDSAVRRIDGETAVDGLDHMNAVHPSTISVSATTSSQSADLVQMFNGTPASYADIRMGFTFDRVFSDQLEKQLSDASEKRIAYLVGPAGSGKTTGVRKALVQLERRGIACWEHDGDFAFPANRWIQIDNDLRKHGQTGVLFIDDAHRHLHRVNHLVDEICAKDDAALRVILVSSKPNWNHRLKASGIYTQGKAYDVGVLSGREIDSLLAILETNPEVISLVEDRFLGFNRNERRRRLVDRCRADVFVCMKNIFASDSFDDIILREYAELVSEYQEVYRQIAAMESAGVRVHRQLVIRTVDIQASQIARYLEDLDGIVTEHTVNERDGVFTWRVRHGVIADIVAKYKFSGEEEKFGLLERVVDNLNPSYPIEIDSMNEICDYQKGLSWIYDKRKQNAPIEKNDFTCTSPTCAAP